MLTSKFQETVYDLNFLLWMFQEKIYFETACVIFYNTKMKLIDNLLQPLILFIERQKSLSHQPQIYLDAFIALHEKS